jgi:hypothetical protein
MLQPSPLKRSLVPRFTNRRGKLKKMIKDALVVEIRECWNCREEDLHGFPCSFSFRVWTRKHLVESDGPSQLCFCCTSLCDLLGSTTRAEAQKGNEPFRIPRLRATPSIGQELPSRIEHWRVQRWSSLGH